MSTNYYCLKSPITYLHLEPRGDYYSLSLWVNHALSGSLMLREDDLSDVIMCFADVVDDTQCPLRTTAGAIDRGIIVHIQDLSLPDDTLLISSHRELLTVREIKALDGKGKRIENIL